MVQGVSDHLAVILEVEWEDTCTELRVEKVVPVYNKIYVSGLKNFFRDKFVVWASNGSNIKDVWNNFKDIVYESIEYFVTHKILRKFRTPNITTSRMND